MSEQTSRLAIIIDSTGAKNNADNLTSSLVKMTQAGETAANSAGKVTKATEEEKSALSELLDCIDPVNAALNKLDKQQQQLAKFKSKGMLDDETFDVYSKKIEEARNRLTGFSERLKEAGMTAKQTAFAMRMLPAQMTDIVVGLSTGQSPFMVLMQQGGQLKDMFGGIGPAIKVVGSYVLGLINPFTLAAAAIGALGLAYYKGSQEQDEFNKSLILTGNQLGTTSGQLADIAARAGEAASSTTGSAASVLNQLVRAGKVASSSLEQVTAAVLKTSEATGISTDQLVNDFNEVAKDPVNAISRLNEQYHFLTVATYNQIKALQAEGKQQEAARVATDVYALTMKQRADEVLQNLGLLERGWNSVTGAIKNATDAILDFGRTPGTATRRQTAFAEWQAAEKEYQALSKNLKVDPNYSGNNPLQKADADRLRNARDLVEIKKRAYEMADKEYAQEGLAAARERQRAEQQERTIRNQQQFDQLVDSGLSIAEKRAKIEAELNKLIQQNKQDAASGVASLWTDSDIAKARAGIEKQYKDPQTPKSKGYSDDAARRMIDHLNQQNALLSSQAEITIKLSLSEQELIKWRQQIADLESRPSSKLTKDQKALLLHRKEITALMEKNVAIENNNRLIKESADIAAWRGSLQASIDNRQQGYDIQIAGYGLGDKKQQRQQELLRIEREYNNQRLQLERDYADKSRGMSDHVFQEKMQDLNDALEREKEIARQKNEQLDIQAGNWVSGASQGFNNWLDDTKDISEQIKSTTTQMFDGMTDALGDFITTGKANFRSFATSVISDLSRIALKASITGIFDSISNSSSGGILGTIGSAVSKFIPNAKGGVYDSPSLSTYSNGIYDSPQFFAFAKGAGVFGEAGPEAIMPLTRAADGSLGVRAINGKSGNGSGDITYAPIYQITIQNDGQNGEIGPHAVKVLMSMIDNHVQTTMQNMRRDGGMLSG